MTLLSFVSYQARRLLLRPRWLLPLPITLFLVYRGMNAVLAMSEMTGASTNAWDAAFMTFGNPDTVYFALTAVFLYLVGDLLPEPVFGQWMMLRLGSRRRWWLGSSLTLALALLVYLALTYGLFMTLIGLVLPYSTQWSAYANQDFIAINMYMKGMHLGPGLNFLYLTGLMALGWYGLGQLMMAAALLFQRPLAGPLIGALALLAGVYGVNISGIYPSSLPLILLYSFHLELTPGVWPVREVPIHLSFLYWLVWIVFFGVVGWWISQRQDLEPASRIG